MSRNKGNSNKNNTNRAKAIAGKITATVLILLVAFTNAIGYIGNAIEDPRNRELWIIIAILVFVAVGAVELKNGGE